MHHEYLIWIVKKGGRRVVKRYVLEDFKCKYCGGSNLVLYGKYHDKQQWFCKDCKRKFSGTTSLPGMRSPVTHVGTALQQYYEGQSQNEICRNIEQQYGYKPANSTVYRWVEDFTNKAIAETKYLPLPKIGDEWVCDETFLKVGGKAYIFWDCIDSDTRYLLASRLVTTRGKRDARALVEAAAERAGKTPKVVVTDKLNSYLDGIELAFGADAQHKQGGPFDIQNNTNLIERFHGSLKDRYKVLRGLKKAETGKRLLDGWLVHYNYFRPHMGLDGKTPAEVAGVNFDHKNWLSLVSSPKRTAKIVVSTESKPVLKLHHSPIMKVPRNAGIPKSKPRMSKSVDLGADIVRDRRGRHLRLY